MIFQSRRPRSITPSTLPPDTLIRQTRLRHAHLRINRSLLEAKLGYKHSIPGPKIGQQVIETIEVTRQSTHVFRNARRHLDHVVFTRTFALGPRRPRGFTRVTQVLAPCDRTSYTAAIK